VRKERERDRDRDRRSRHEVARPSRDGQGRIIVDVGGPAGVDLRREGIGIDLRWCILKGREVDMAIGTEIDTGDRTHVVLCMYVLVL
jgi:hypothetical protein